MKVFISWSGERSKFIAEALRYWLPKVIQAVQPWLSANDIEKGARWRTDIANELELSGIGIICLTPENLDSPWIHFEAGALSKQQLTTYVCTFLYELEPPDIREPLAQFQTTRTQKEDIKRLIFTINNTQGSSKLTELELDEQFEVWWPKLEERLAVIPELSTIPSPKRSEREILEEVLESIRSHFRYIKPEWEFAASIGSEIRNPLAVIQLACSMLKDDKESPLTNAQLEHLNTILRNARVINSLATALWHPAYLRALTSRAESEEDNNEDSDS